jgi:hypothetical protein
MTSPAATALPPAQRDVLRQALADAVYYRDPPLHCADCEALGRLCRQCIAGLCQARAYLALSRELGISPPEADSQPRDPPGVATH